jgi:hypothetical protein
LIGLDATRRGCLATLAASFAHRPAINLLPKIISTSLNRDYSGFPFDCAGLHAVT